VERIKLAQNTLTALAINDCAPWRGIAWDTRRVPVKPTHCITNL